MLKNIDPLLTGDLLKILDDMGHGDLLALVDNNFPAHRYDVPVIALRGNDVDRVARAILSVFPLDSFVAEPIRRMEIDGAPDEITDVTRALGELATELEGREIGIEPVERFAFYEQCKGAYAVVQTSETVGYSCYLLQKGVI